MITFRDEFQDSAGKIGTKQGPVAITCPWPELRLSPCSSDRSGIRKRSAQVDFAILSDTVLSVPAGGATGGLAPHGL